MGKVFIHKAKADQLAFEFYAKLREIEKMPQVYFTFDGGKLFIGDRANPRMFHEYTVELVLQLDPKKALESGGTYRALLESSRRRGQVPQAVVEEEVHSLLSGEN